VPCYANIAGRPPARLFTVGGQERFIPEHSEDPLPGRQPQLSGLDLFRPEMLALRSFRNGRRAARNVPARTPNDKLPFPGRATQIHRRRAPRGTTGQRETSAGYGDLATGSDEDHVGGETLYITERGVAVARYPHPRASPGSTVG
jgi:hypothetical protein